MSTYWNAKVYDEIATPMANWAETLINDLQLTGHETVLDAGCGSGKVTLSLAKRLPGGRIYAVDSSIEMIDELKAKLSADHDITGCTIVPLVASLTDFQLPEQVDVVFSNAVFHWIDDDAALFRNLFDVTKHGGRLRAQCGGAGNISRVNAAVDEVQPKPEYRQWLSSGFSAKRFRTEAEAIQAMANAGWHNMIANSFDAPVVFDDDESSITYMQTIFLRDHIAKIPPELSRQYVLDVLTAYFQLYGRPFVADYVRLNLSAQKPQS